MESHPLYQAVATQAALPGFRLTSFVELVKTLIKSAVDTPEERAQIKGALMAAYAAFVAPRVGHSDLMKMLAEAAIDAVLNGVSS